MNKNVGASASPTPHYPAPGARFRHNLIAKVFVVYEMHYNPWHADP